MKPMNVLIALVLVAAASALGATAAIACPTKENTAVQGPMRHDGLVDLDLVASSAGCSGGGAGSSSGAPSAGQPSNGASQTTYGAESYATASAKWSSRDSTPQQAYHDVAYSAGCGGTYGRCYWQFGCTGTCASYRAATEATCVNDCRAGSGNDAEAEVSG